MSDVYAEFFPRTRTGKECTKVKCKRHKSYTRWIPGDGNLKFCMECKNAHVSQYSKAALADKSNTTPRRINDANEILKEE